MLDCAKDETKFITQISTSQRRWEETDVDVESASRPCDIENGSIRSRILEQGDESSRISRRPKASRRTSNPICLVNFWRAPNEHRLTFKFIILGR